MFSMGFNDLGKLGINSRDITCCDVPTLIEGVCGIQKVSCGVSHCLALSYEREVYAWGESKYGALGFESNDYILKPVIVPRLKKNIV